MLTFHLGHHQVQEPSFMTEALIQKVSQIESTMLREAFCKTSPSSPFIDSMSGSWWGIL